ENHKQLKQEEAEGRTSKEKEEKARKAEEEKARQAEQARKQVEARKQRERKEAEERARNAKVERAELPDETVVAKAVKEIQETYKDDYARLETAKAVQALAARLFDAARHTKDNRIKRFALYREVRDLAARALDL